MGPVPRGKNGARLALLVVLVLASGCLGADEDDPLPPDKDPEEDQEPAPDPDPDADPEADDEQGNISWSNTVKEDRYTGTNAGVGIGNTSHTFTVEANVTTLFFNLSTDGSELILGIIDPQCPDNMICEDESTQDGSLSHRVDAPITGEWELGVRAGELFHYEQTYRLEVNLGREPG